jgi:hypothetical protein
MQLVERASSRAWWIAIWICSGAVPEPAASTIALDGALTRDKQLRAVAPLPGLLGCEQAFLGVGEAVQRH